MDYPILTEEDKVIIFLYSINSDDFKSIEVKKDYIYWYINNDDIKKIYFYLINKQNDFLS